jgi:sugar lactone lactonase YvrE
MKSADGIFYDHATQRIYVADILANAIQAVTLDGRVETVAQDADNDGSAGQLDGPSEAVVRGQELIVANFGSGAATFATPAAGSKHGLQARPPMPWRRPTRQLRTAGLG